MHCLTLSWENIDPYFSSRFIVNPSIRHHIFYIYSSSTLFQGANLKLVVYPAALKVLTTNGFLEKLTQKYMKL